MGYAARANPNTTPRRQRQLTQAKQIRRLMRSFRTRTEFDRWVEARSVSADVRAHCLRHAPSEPRWALM